MKKRYGSKSGRGGVVMLDELQSLAGGEGADVVQVSEERCLAMVNEMLERGLAAAVERGRRGERERPVKRDDSEDWLEVDQVRVSEVEAADVEWLWPGRFALGKVSLIAGIPGTGKSMVTLDMAARVSRGWAWPGEELWAGGVGQGVKQGQGGKQDSFNAASHRFAVRATGSVLLLSAEDDLADTIRPRLEAAGADCERIVAIRALVDSRGSDSAREGDNAPGGGGTRRGGNAVRTLDLGRDLSRLAAVLDGMPDCRLVVVDPISAYLSTAFENTNTAARRLLAPLARLAAERRVAVLAVTHLRKQQGTAIERAIGSVAFVAAARTAWLVGVDPESAERRLLVPLKNNLAAARGGLAYTIVPRGKQGAPMVVWGPHPVPMDADELLQTAGKAKAERTSRADAIDWLRDYLAGCPRFASEVRSDAERAGINYGQLRRAFLDLNGKSTQLGKGVPTVWMWSLPEESMPTGAVGGAGRNF
jgi:putative DNA primase/helicase